ncbi:MAG: sigma 54-interacting transcriptional regulator [Candidatus Delongbacteria bacterium]|nr:sigma 54-interacting transcriptional regulator [Candidatus Delongbacteria bacterium]MBN2836473.1 sigma 54-interacting transcriptional regulator [Candidatus Delongbacteria bacterium]
MSGFENNNFYLQILQSISDGVFTVDENWNITSFNKAAENITKVKYSQAIGRKCYEVFKSNMCENDCPLRKTIESGKAIINKTGYIVNINGNRIPISLSTSLFKGENGKILGGAETFRDLSNLEILKNQYSKENSYGSFISKNDMIKKIFHLAEIASNSGSSILITGETGTGKEVLAKSIHNSSKVTKKPFVAVNCGAIPDNLIESELFGYVKGAFTGADGTKPGKFELAEGGTLFLDEIGELPLHVQVKLLRVLSEKSVEPLGSTKSIKINVRIISATNRNLQEMVKEGKFRQDLFYRLNVINFNIPPLRDRKDDLVILSEHFIKKFNIIMGKKIEGISQNLLEKMFNYNWPGNVRELENFIERAFIFSRSDFLECTDISLFDNESNNFNEDSTISDNLSKKEKIEKALKDNNWNRAKTARALGVNNSTLYRNIQKYEIALPESDGRSKI